jgi:hypothetical protein
MNIPTTISLPVWIVRLFDPVPIKTDVVLVAEVPGALIAVCAKDSASDADAAAFVSAVSACVLAVSAASLLVFAPVAKAFASSVQVEIFPNQVSIRLEKVLGDFLDGTGLRSVVIVSVIM